MKILILDDIKDYVDSLSRALSGEYEVIKAFSLNEAKEKMNENIKLVLADVRLSEDDLSNREGLIFLGWVKENYPDIPVIMMSAYRDFDSVVDALNLGASYYLKKPINLKEMKDAIAKYIKKI